MHIKSLKSFIIMGFLAGLGSAGAGQDGIPSAPVSDLAVPTVSLTPLKAALDNVREYFKNTGDALTILHGNSGYTSYGPNNQSHRLKVNTSSQPTFYDDYLVTGPMTEAQKSQNPPLFPPYALVVAKHCLEDYNNPQLFQQRTTITKQELMAHYRENRVLWAVAEIKERNYNPFFNLYKNSEGTGTVYFDCNKVPKHEPKDAERSYNAPLPYFQSRMGVPHDFCWFSHCLGLGLEQQFQTLRFKTELAYVKKYFEGETHDLTILPLNNGQFRIGGDIKLTNGADQKKTFEYWAMEIAGEDFAQKIKDLTTLNPHLNLKTLSKNQLIEWWREGVFKTYQIIHLIHPDSEGKPGEASIVFDLTHSMDSALKVNPETDSETAFLNTSFTKEMTVSENFCWLTYFLGLAQKD
jgi:hypothetical protein